MLIRLAFKSVLNRKSSVLLMLLAMSLGMAALLLTKVLSSELERGFNSSVSGTDLLVGARSHPVQVVLYSVFRLGSATQAMSWQRYQEVVQNPQVAWSFPIALGDSHQGYPVVGTDNLYFKQFKFADKQPLKFVAGHDFKQTTDAVLGAAIARELNYKIGYKIFLSHGLASHSFVEHKESSFVVTGILQATGTPVDRSVHVHHKALEALHLPKWKYQLNQVALEDLPNPKVISSVFIGLKSRFMTFKMQRELNRAHKEPLTAVIPGVALSELWNMMRSAEQILNVLTWLMLLVSLVGMAAMLQATVVTRLPEIALFRMMGARPWRIFWLLELEIILLVCAAWLAALVLTFATELAVQYPLANYFGVRIELGLPLVETSLFIGGSLLLAILMGILPALSVYRMALNKQLF